MRQNLQRILVRGGVLSPSELKQIVELAELAGIDALMFGSRQDILLPTDQDLSVIAQDFPQLSIENLSANVYQNILCSYVSADIFPGTAWLSSAMYLYVLEQFTEPQKLEINITDPKQRLVPLFTGHLNFIASSVEDYWHFYVRLPHWQKPEAFPVLIYSWDMARIAKAIENLSAPIADIATLFNYLNTTLETNSRVPQEPLQLPSYTFPYYEGMNRFNVDQYWLGLYWRNNRYDLTFLKAMCDLCFECKIGKICITPWKSFIVKGIHQRYEMAWQKLLGRFGINERHSSLEMNWHVPASDDEAMDLKRFIVRNFDQNDISTYGLTFGITSTYSINFTSILIQRNPQPRVVQHFQVRPTYNVLHAKNFDPNTLQYETYAQDVDKIELPGLLMELSRLYFEGLGAVSAAQKPLVVAVPPPIRHLHDHHEAFQCPNCLSVYDSRFGDVLQNILAGVAFSALPEDYCCGVCETGKEEFVAMEGSTQLG
ncbi:rubredoxin [Haliscomenobacter hydrossis]|uniref:Rubredoxin-type Fe(Cys)4 protein n=1 Tax=Haliscomenobacter hydrossis (strain ATCC 27775 / DSM 1100 / LMG 10767 / O) TaxID=760192 RepID=F4KUK1_HALH1|nr:rubredoxin [Haliscomenobacter hydrossis]AEE52437.1 Rubredoxin-type Fe(Cys)4 protein [Haliscomenobacter hydrossis DSM 1100]